MRYIRFILLLMTSVLFGTVHAQIENVIVETYYISDDIDSTDNTGGKLMSGSTTYRIYIDLMPGNKIKKIYGDANHALKFLSTANFFNNIADGQSFAKDFAKTRYGDNTVALDTWLTIGQTTKTQSNKTYFGILKTQDIDGSFIGGTNNDGGSEVVPSGLLTNNVVSIGVPLTVADGMDTMVTIPNSWFNNGFIDVISGEDSTMFGSVKLNNQFISNNAALLNSGTMGVIPDSNQVLIAQLTTRGTIKFELNIEIEEIVNGIPTVVKYVADNGVLLPGEKHSPLLKFPPACGCKDPNYLEYSSTYACAQNSDCKTRIVFGCTDTMACNYDPNANYLIKELCCYPGSCYGRDISLVCPSVKENSFEFTVFPNPTQGNIIVDISTGLNKEIKYSIFDSYGVLVLENNLGIKTGTIVEEIDLSSLNSGLYFIKVSSDNLLQSKLFMKN